MQWNAVRSSPSETSDHADPSSTDQDEELDTQVRYIPRGQRTDTNRKKIAPSCKYKIPGGGTAPHLTADQMPCNIHSMRLSEKRNSHVVEIVRDEDVSSDQQTFESRQSLLQRFLVTSQKRQRPSTWPGPLIEGRNQSHPPDFIVRSTRRKGNTLAHVETWEALRIPPDLMDTISGVYGNVPNDIVSVALPHILTEEHDALRVSCASQRAWKELLALSTSLCLIEEHGWLPLRHEPENAVVLHLYLILTESSVRSSSSTEQSFQEADASVRNLIRKTVPHSVGSNKGIVYLMLSLNQSTWTGSENGSGSLFECSPYLILRQIFVVVQDDVLDDNCANRLHQLLSSIHVHARKINATITYIVLGSTSTSRKQIAPSRHVKNDALHDVSKMLDASSTGKHLRSRREHCTTTKASRIPSRGQEVIGPIPRTRLTSCAILEDVLQQAVYRFGDSYAEIVEAGSS